MKGGKFELKVRFRPRGVCSQLMEIEIDGDKIVKVDAVGGCSGNLQGISRLVEGMKVDDAIAKMKGIRCGGKPTSCPDQLAIALERMKSES